MLHPSRTPDDRRRGVILLVVLAMITLLAILGLTFVMQADATATSARIYREAQTLSGYSNLRDVIVADASLSWESFLGQLLYDVNDDASGILSAMRGHSLGRTMYGWNPASTLNDRPWTGTGRLAEGTAMGSGDGLVNYQYSSATPTFLRDPGRTGVRTSPTGTLGTITGDLNVAYTYPDRNNMFLAMQDPASGQILVPSYHRSDVGGTLAPANPHWTSGDGKYRLMRLRPADMGAGFPYPADPGGDVKNLDWAAGGKDSIWIDFNAPIKTFEGRKYKCLVAPLVLEMDGRINLQTAGNLLGPSGNEHASNQGWGPYEVNPRYVLNGHATEWKQMFTGVGSVAGKYGPASLPRGTAVSGGTTVGARYPIDFNGIVDPPFPPATLALSGPISFPGSGIVPYRLFPDYTTSNSYNNAVPRETTSDGTMAGTPNHPSLYNVFRPKAGPLGPTDKNRNFDASELAALLRLQNLGAEGLSSDVLSLLSTNLKGGSPTANGTNQAYRRNLVTTLSMDLDRPGSPPYVYNRNADGQAYTYKNAATPNDAFASANPQAFPGVAARATPMPTSEFDAATWKSNLPGLRIDLKRTLTNYPTPDLTTWRFLDPQKAQVQQAVGDRQQLAREVFERLRLVTGAMTATDALNGGLSVDGTAGGPTSPQFRALRWLAQHAVNLVDFIDNDDYSTPFQFAAGHWVYGVEVPRLVINETYAQWDNDRATLMESPAGSGKWQQPATGNYRVNVWAELHNPNPADSNHPEGGTARLHNGTNSTNGWAMYRLRLSEKRSPGIRTPENVTGADDAGITSSRVDYWGSTDATRTVKPGMGQFKESAPKGNAGFYLVGPNPDYSEAGSTKPSLTLTDPGFGAQATYQAVDGPPPPMPAMATSRMSFLKSVTTDPTTNRATSDEQPSLYLEKLANPYLPENTDQTSPLYNPYVVVDYVERIRVEDGRLFTHQAATEPPAPPAKPTPATFAAITDRVSLGKWHPLAGAQEFMRQAAPATPSSTQPKHTFFRQNCVEDTDTPAPSASTANQTMQVPFDTFAHLDRIPTTLGELMHVSGVRPHELTQQFMAGTFAAPKHFAHRARFSEEGTRLHRLLDQVTLSPWAAGVAMHGRIPGKVNLNAIRDQKVFNALVDRATANQFTQAEVDEVWAELVASRNVRPFGSLATGQATANDELSSGGRGLNSTLLRPKLVTGTQPAPASDAGQQRMLESTAAFNGAFPGGQPLRRFELMSKLMGNLTTRSNVFAVWATVGFFEVTDDTTSPAKLGAEINWPSLGVVRHRMFAIVDRTQMQSFPTVDERGRAMCSCPSAVSPSVDPTTRTPQPVTFSLRNADGASLGNTAAVTNVDTGRAWRPEAGALLTFDPDSDNEETVEVVAVDKGTDPNAWRVQAVFYKSHGAGAAVINRGNPGPWLRYDPRRDLAVVPYSIVFE